MRQRIVMHPAEQKRQTRKRLVRVARKLEWALDQIIAALDEIDGDPDHEPSLGSVTTASHYDQRLWAQGVNDNREHDPAEDRLFDESEWEPSLAEPSARSHAAAFVFDDLDALYQGVSQAYRLSMSLPTFPLEQFLNETQGLGATEVDQMVRVRRGQDIFRIALPPYVTL